MRFVSPRYVTVDEYRCGTN